MKSNASYNVGEWSELYAFLKIMLMREIPAADSDLNIIPNVSYPVTKIKRNDKKLKKGEEKTYRSYDLSSEKEIKVHIHKDESTQTFEVSYNVISKNLPNILSAIKRVKKSTKGSFSLPEAQSLIDVLKPGKIKQDSLSKEDIILVLRDHITSQENTVGFSVKSYLGGNATLINASGPTFFRYAVENLVGELDEINNTEGHRKLRRRVESVTANGGEISFSEIINPIFEKNLRKIDSFLPEIIAEFIQAFFSSKGNSIADLTAYVVDNSLLKGPILQNFDYEDIKYKVKQLLISSALGMVPGTDWDGVVKADGGYVIVRADGEVVCYHVYNISDLSEYLFNNTKLDTPSSGRHPFAVFFQDGNRISYDYPLLVRFK